MRTDDVARLQVPGCLSGGSVVTGRCRGGVLRSSTADEAPSVLDPVSGDPFVQ
jgi:hypothetical protein